MLYVKLRIMQVVELALCTSVLLVLHHRYIHNDDENLTEFEKFFQVSDAHNHETCVLFLLGISLGSYIERHKLLD